MALNSSNATHHFSPPSSSIRLNNFILDCFHSTVGIFNITALTIISILFLPVYVFILKLGHQKWQQKHSTTTMTHSDLITYHIVFLELMNIIGSIFCCCGVYTGLPEITTLGLLVAPLRLTGELMFHVLTCVERYLAVVHPVTYLRLRTTNGIRFRTIIIACVWGLSVASVATLLIVDELSLILLSSCTIGFVVLLISFCSISVLCVLVRPRPGEGVADRQLVNQSKLRAFYTIVFILGVLLLRSGSNLLTIIKVDSLHLGENEKCGMWLSVFWFCLPSSLVLPLLFLQRAGKLEICKKKPQIR